MPEFRRETTTPGYLQ